LRGPRRKRSGGGFPLSPKIPEPFPVALRRASRQCTGGGT